MLLEIKNLLINFGSSQQAVCAVDTVSLSIGVGETVCLVGESGSEKTVTALSIARLLSSPPAHYPGGEILLEGRSVLRASRGVGVLPGVFNRSLPVFWRIFWSRAEAGGAIRVTSERKRGRQREHIQPC
ncbi:MAG: hypothetical protein ACLQU4_07980 [Limisphaerales bacterium]